MKLFKILVLVFFSLLFGQLSYGQDYYPLQVGNVWYNSAVPEFIDSTVIIDSVEYFEFCLPFDCYYFREDSSGNIYVRYAKESEEYLIFKIDAEIGETWFCKKYDGWDFEATLESKSDTVIIKDTTYSECYRFYYRP